MLTIGDAFGWSAVEILQAALAASFTDDVRTALLLGHSWHRALTGKLVLWLLDYADPNDRIEVKYEENQIIAEWHHDKHTVTAWITV